MGKRGERGSATVELAFAIPTLVVFLLLMVQVGVVMLQQVAVTQAAREGARAAAVDPTPGAATAAIAHTTALNQKKLSVLSKTDSDGFVRVTVGFTGQITMPVTGVVLLRPQVHATAAMKVEVK